ncbi:MAG: DUF1667 domain-containing protein [Oscillospiraceae bacterium]|jgi:CxxC motif-containing protein
MREKNIICTICPIGCHITVRGEDQVVHSIEGNQCLRGEEYARNEFIQPMRILTTTVKVEGGDTPLLPVRSDRPVPLEKLMECMEVIKEVSVSKPVNRYQVIIPNILGTEANIVATGEIL